MDQNVTKNFNHNEKWRVKFITKFVKSVYHTYTIVHTFYLFPNPCRDKNK